MKTVLKIFLIFIFATLSFGGTYKETTFKIDAAKNASSHNNMGVMYLKEGDYSSAITEFQIAIQLNPNTQASGIYYNNLGKTYLNIGYPNLAEKAFWEAYKRNNANFEYYQNIVKSFRAQGKLQTKLRYYMMDSKPNAAVFAGLILIEQGKLEAGINKLDEFCFEEPEMILTKGIKTYLRELAPNDFRFE